LQAATGQACDLGNVASPLAILRRALSVFSCRCGPRVKRKEALLTRLRNAVASLAGRLEALASTVGAIDGELRQRVDLDAPVHGPVLDYSPPAPTDGDGRRAKPARGRK
jgi:hypothetical protein